MTRPAAPGETSSEFARDIYAEGQRRLCARAKRGDRRVRERFDKEERRSNFYTSGSITALVREVERLQAIVAANQREEK